MLENILNEAVNFTGGTPTLPTQYTLASDDELKTMISSLAYSQEYKNAAKLELQKRVDKAKLTNKPYAILNPLIKNYWWQSINLKGYPESYPPVVSEGAVFTSVGSPSCEVWGTYNGNLGCYDVQEKEHSEYMKKWFKDNAPGDEFYKNNPFYIKGDDGLPVFNYDADRRKTPQGFADEEYPIYLAECNNIINKYQATLNLLKKNRDSDIGRLQAQINEFNKNLADQKTRASEPDPNVRYMGQSGMLYDPSGGIGAARGASGLPVTGKPKLDDFLVGQMLNPPENVTGPINKQIANRQTQYANEVANTNKKKDKELVDLKKEYYHADFPNGITKENYAKYLKFGERLREKYRYYETQKQIEMDKQRIINRGHEADALRVEPIYRDKSLDNYFKSNSGFEPTPENIDIPSKLKDYKDIDWELDAIRKNVVQQFSELNTYETYVGEFKAVQLQFGYSKELKPELEVKKPWHGDFYEDGKIGENFVYWLTSWDIHDVLMLASLVAMVIPGLQGVGLAMRLTGMSRATALGLGLTEAALLSAAIDLLDAGIYLSESNNRMAGLSVLFAFIPFAVESVLLKTVFKQGAQGVKQAIKFIMACPDFLVKSVTTMTMKELAAYTKLMLKPEIQAALKIIAENGSTLQRMIQEGAAKVLSVGNAKFGTKTIAEYTNAVLNFSAKGLMAVGPPLVKAGATLGGYMALGEAYNAGVDEVQKISETPKTVVERILGKDSWSIVKNQFMSDGSVNDNNLLKKAILSGWRPGMPIPEEYQTSSYKKEHQEKKEKTKEQVKQPIPEDMVAIITEIMKSPEVTKKLKEEKLKDKEKEIDDYTKQKTITEKKWQEILKKAREDEKLINQQNQQNAQNESNWVKFLKTNYIIG